MTHCRRQVQTGYLTSHGNIRFGDKSLPFTRFFTLSPANATVKYVPGRYKELLRPPNYLLLLVACFHRLVNEIFPFPQSDRILDVAVTQVDVHRLTIVHIGEWLPSEIFVAPQDLEFHVPFRPWTNVCAISQNLLDCNALHMGQGSRKVEGLKESTKSYQNSQGLTKSSMKQLPKYRGPSRSGSSGAAHFPYGALGRGAEMKARCQGCPKHVLRQFSRGTAYDRDIQICQNLVYITD
ncbi:hypothetical protein C8R44DRAFT_941226 [Mycena epipterygia]|nr:hypothetical protein C8R44DRAFT_941226 [Mycena epipterygia]